MPFEALCICYILCKLRDMVQLQYHLALCNMRRCAAASVQHALVCKLTVQSDSCFTETMLSSTILQTPLPLTLPGELLDYTRIVAAAAASRSVSRMSVSS